MLNKNYLPSTPCGLITRISADKRSYLRKRKTVIVGHYRGNHKEGRHKTAQTEKFPAKVKEF